MKPDLGPVSLPLNQTEVLSKNVAGMFFLFWREQEMAVVCLNTTLVPSCFSELKYVCCISNSISRYLSWKIRWHDPVWPGKINSWWASVTEFSTIFQEISERGSCMIRFIPVGFIVQSVPASKRTVRYLSIKNRYTVVDNIIKQASSINSVLCSFLGYHRTQTLSHTQTGSDMKELQCWPVSFMYSKGLFFFPTSTNYWNFVQINTQS